MTQGFRFLQGLGRLSLVAASAAQSAASVVQAGTKEITAKVCRIWNNIGLPYIYLDKKLPL